MRLVLRQDTVHVFNVVQFQLSVAGVSVLFLADRGKAGVRDLHRRARNLEPNRIAGLYIVARPTRYDAQLPVQVLHAFKNERRIVRLAVSLLADGREARPIGIELQIAASLVERAVGRKGAGCQQRSKHYK